ncbi:hypothetical protein A9255_06935 [Xenorhabdus hominickii]|uniref:Uncharacterized protein n=1 Tax=Xenorhabdus hominickii TaxID=351679 RepID=A0ABM6DR07_XENHO|nr:hypothetical protein A9255_06935 [Xenorhabdus hominickii]
MNVLIIKTSIFVLNRNLIVMVMKLSLPIDSNAILISPYLKFAIMVMLKQKSLRRMVMLKYLPS